MDHDQLVNDLRDLGLRSGDLVLIRAATAAILPGDKGNATALRDAALEAIGPRGALVALTFTASQFRRNSPRRTVFTPAAATISGGFSAAVLSHESGVRSAHPFDSITAIGPRAAELIEGHDEQALSFSWMGRFIELGGKQAVVGAWKQAPA